ncbi:unnamed protein product, partial [Mesorhabditis belari]|uniref:Uncharacterized protein n=1 Tax=Mesorhabditis belari TaxID=2138241 RepID=A0AAF3J1P1_9BILA
MHPLVSWFLLIVLLFSLSTQAQLEDDDDISFEKRAAPMRNALVRFGRAAPNGGLRNALVRFGKRSSVSTQDKRNAQPQPFVRFETTKTFFP